MRRWWLLPLLLALALPATRGGAQVQEEASLSVDPPSQTIGPETATFEVRVLVDDVTGAQGLGGYTLVMTYDPDVLHATAVADSGFVESTGNPVVCPASATDNDAGRLAHFCLTVPIFEAPGPQTSEPQVLATVTFQPVGPGATALDIGESTLIDPQGNGLLTAVVGGEVTVESGSQAQATQPAADAATASATESDGEQNVGLYVGLGVGGVVVLVIVGAALAFLGRGRRKEAST